MIAIRLYYIDLGVFFTLGRNNAAHSYYRVLVPVGMVAGVWMLRFSSSSSSELVKVESDDKLLVLVFESDLVGLP